MDIPSPLPRFDGNSHSRTLCGVLVEHSQCIVVAPRSPRTVSSMYEDGLPRFDQKTQSGP